MISESDLTEFVDGTALVEYPVNIASILQGCCILGGYTIISEGCQIRNIIAGRFTNIEKGVSFLNINNENSFFSSHPFTSSEKNIFPDDPYYESIMSTRNFHENDSYTIIGNDVSIKFNSIIKSGVKIGNGAIVMPNSVVIDDVEPYTIVSGSPAITIGLRFNKSDIQRINNSKWWDFDINPAISHFKLKAKSNNIDYSSPSLFDAIVNSSKNLPKLKLKTYSINSKSKLIIEHDKKNLIIGPSHVYIWNELCVNGRSKLPANSFIIPTNALSSFSLNGNEIIKWGSENFEKVIYFVPDFRIGNAGTSNLDGRFISTSSMSDGNDRKCYELGLTSLDKLSSMKNVKFIFWCLYGREFLNKEKGNYITDGIYCHPIWNFNFLVKRYANNTININNFNFNFKKDIHDRTIHPTISCYDKISELINSL